MRDADSLVVSAFSLTALKPIGSQGVRLCTRTELDSFPGLFLSRQIVPFVSSMVNSFAPEIVLPQKLFVFSSRL